MYKNKFFKTSGIFTVSRYVYVLSFEFNKKQRKVINDL